MLVTCSTGIKPGETGEPTNYFDFPVNPAEEVYVFVDVCLKNVQEEPILYWDKWVEECRSVSLLQEVLFCVCGCLFVC